MQHHHADMDTVRQTGEVKDEEWLKHVVTDYCWCLLYRCGDRLQHCSQTGTFKSLYPSQQQQLLLLLLVIQSLCVSSVLLAAKHQTWPLVCELSQKTWIVVTISIINCILLFPPWLHVQCHPARCSRWAFWCISPVSQDWLEQRFYVSVWCSYWSSGCRSLSSPPSPCECPQSDRKDTKPGVNVWLQAMLQNIVWYVMFPNLAG